MNKFQLQKIRLYPIGKYVIKYEKEYFKDAYDLNIEQVFTYKRIYKMSKVLEERVIDMRYLIKNSSGK